MGRARPALTPLTNQISYFCVQPMADEDLKQYLHDPVAALPPSAVKFLPKLAVVLVPYLERSDARSAEIITFERPPEHRYSYCSRFEDSRGVVLVMAVKEEESANYHYTFYQEIATLLADHGEVPVREGFWRILREELKGEVHGEVDDRSWRLKQVLLRRQTNVRKETKIFREYARQALIDTLTLYLHGICCDIDVETGPRQLSSRYLRRRLELLNSMFPPPEGYTVFPEQAKGR